LQRLAIKDICGIDYAVDIICENARNALYTILC
jgi:hypothetical protein